MRPSLTKSKAEQHAGIIKGADYNVRSIIELLSELHWTSLDATCSQYFKTLLYKTMNDMVPDYLSETCF